jgi:hypothetical protein
MRHLILKVIHSFWLWTILCFINFFIFLICFDLQLYKSCIIPLVTMLVCFFNAYMNLKKEKDENSSE